MKKIVLAAALVALSSGSAYAAQGTGSATANVIAPIAVTHTVGASLNFGTFDAGTGGTVTVTAANVASSTGVTVVSGSTTSADAFTIAGDGTRGYTISTAAGSVTSGLNSMAFTTTPSAATGALVAGAGSFTVGGTLTVSSGQAVGSYAGSYIATVNYN